MVDYDVIVIGAGCGGLTAAAILAKQGRRVLVLEQSDQIGGACSSYEKDGYIFDIGACLLEVVEPVELAFEMLGTTLREEVDLVPLDPLYDFVLEDGSRLKVPFSIEDTTRTIAGIEPKEADNWMRFIDYMSGFYGQVLDSFFTNPANSFGDVVKMFAKKPGILRYLSLFSKNYQEVIEKYFTDRVVQEITGFQSCYFNLSPEQCPGIFAILVYAEHIGTFYPRGGMIQIPRALRRVGEKYGLEVRLDSRVEKVLVCNRKVEGVALAGGDEITCDVLVSNVNAQNLYLDMIGKEHLPWLARYGIKSYRLSDAVCILNLGLDYRPPLEAHLTAYGASLQKMNKFDHDRHRGVLHDEMLGLICWTSLSDLALAPEGKHALNIVVEGPYQLAGTDWNREREPYIEKAIKYYGRIIPDLADHIEVAELLTPIDYEKRLLMPGGAIYDINMDLSASAVFRPSSKSRSIEGLYLVGASTHPGGGVPMVIGSGLSGARLIEECE